MHRLADRDFLAALLLFFIGAVSLSQAGSEQRDWMLPLLATYTILAIAAALLLRFLIVVVINNAPDVVRMLREERPIYADLIVFGIIVLIWQSLMFLIGFWIASFFMLFAASFYLTLEKTRKNLALDVIVPLGACVVAFFVFLHVFYVPLPVPSWGPFAQ